MKKPFHNFWRPLHFEVTKNDIRTVSGDLVKLYLEVLEAYWLSGCDLDYDAFRDGLGGQGKLLDKLFQRIASLEVIDGKVHHDHTLGEFERSEAIRQGASKAGLASAKVRRAKTKMEVVK